VVVAHLRREARAVPRTPTFGFRPDDVQVGVHGGVQRKSEPSSWTSANIRSRSGALQPLPPQLHPFRAFTSGFREFLCCFGGCPRGYPQVSRVISRVPINFAYAAYARRRSGSQRQRWTFAGSIPIKLVQRHVAVGMPYAVPYSTHEGRRPVSLHVTRGDRAVGSKYSKCRLSCGFSGKNAGRWHQR
jgi:hypothetical protein